MREVCEECGPSFLPGRKRARQETVLPAGEVQREEVHRYVHASACSLPSFLPSSQSAAVAGMSGKATVR